MNELVPAHYVAPKITTFIGVEDSESHLTAFNAQMIISGGLDTVRCKMFMSTFTGTTIQWTPRWPYHLFFAVRQIVSRAVLCQPSQAPSLI